MDETRGTYGVGAGCGCQIDAGGRVFVDHCVCPGFVEVPSRPNGMRGSWTWPEPTSPVPGAILAALPVDGTPMRAADLLAAVHRTLPETASSTISVRLCDLARDRRSGVERISYGVYRRASAP